MKVRCIQNRPTPEQIEAFSINAKNSSVPYVTIGKEYLVLGYNVLTVPDGPFGLGVLLQIIDDFDRWALAPLYLFEITDPRPSIYWRAKKDLDNTMALLPESFHQAYYADMLTDGEPEIVADFERVRGLLEAEFREDTDDDHSAS